MGILISLIDPTPPTAHSSILSHIAALKERKDAIALLAMVDWLNGLTSHGVDKLSLKEERIVPISGASLRIGPSENWKHSPSLYKITSPEIQQTSMLLKLPPELRNEIYELTFRNNRSTKKLWINLLPARPHLQKSLLLSCQKIYYEASGLYKAIYRSYWTSNRFFTSLNVKVTDIYELNYRDIEHITHLRLLPYLRHENQRAFLIEKQMADAMAYPNSGHIWDRFANGTWKTGSGRTEPWDKYARWIRFRQSRGPKAIADVGRSEDELRSSQGFGPRFHIWEELYLVFQQFSRRPCEHYKYRATTRHLLLHAYRQYGWKDRNHHLRIARARESRADFRSTQGAWYKRLQEMTGRPPVLHQV